MDCVIHPVYDADLKPNVHQKKKKTGNKVSLYYWQLRENAQKWPKSILTQHLILSSFV